MVVAMVVVVVMAVIVRVIVGVRDGAHFFLLLLTSAGCTSLALLPNELRA